MAILSSAVLLWFVPFQTYTIHPLQHFPTLFGQIRDACMDIWVLSDPFSNVPGFVDNQRNSRYLHQMWTIPVEFRGSMIIFLFCASCYRLRPKHRMILCLVMIISAYFWNAIYVALFLEGILLNDLEFSLNNRDEKQAVLPPISPKRTSYLPTLASFSIALACVAMLGWPKDLQGTDPRIWHFLDRLCPYDFSFHPYFREHFWPSVAAPFLVLCIQRSPSFQIPLKWKISQYLGHLSFGLYLIHIPVQAMIINPHFVPLQSHYLGNSRLASAFVMGWTWVILLWAADYMTRLDDFFLKWIRRTQVWVFDQNRVHL